MLHLLWYSLCHDKPTLILEKDNMWNCMLYVTIILHNLEIRWEIGCFFSFFLVFSFLNYNFHVRFKWASHSGRFFVLPNPIHEAPTISFKLHNFHQIHQNWSYLKSTYSLSTYMQILTNYFCVILGLNTRYRCPLIQNMHGTMIIHTVYTSCFVLSSTQDNALDIFSNPQI